MVFDGFAMWVVSFELVNIIILIYYTIYDFMIHVEAIHHNGILSVKIVLLFLNNCLYP